MQARAAGPVGAGAVGAVGLTGTAPANAAVPRVSRIVIHAGEPSAGRLRLHNGSATTPARDRRIVPHPGTPPESPPHLLPGQLVLPPDPEDPMNRTQWRRLSAAVVALGVALVPTAAFADSSSPTATSSASESNAAERRRSPSASCRTSTRSTRSSASSSSSYEVWSATYDHADRLQPEGLLAGPPAGHLVGGVRRPH